MEYQDFDAKLRMSASALGCASRKDLVARFRAVNKASQCDLDRLYKWLQGRSLPRSADVLQDWAKTLGSKRSGAWLASCPLADFAAELAALFDRNAQDLLASMAFAGRGLRTSQPASAAEPRMSGVRYLCGTYACYSAAWSSYARGKLIRGSLVIAPGRGASLSAVYSELLMGKPVRVSGEPVMGRGTIHMTLTELGGDMPIFFSLFLPRPPAGVLSGIIAGATFLSPEPEPSASRIVMIRVPRQGWLDSSNRYMTTHPGGVAADLEELGLGPGELEQVDRLVYRFLVQDGDVEHVNMEVHAALAASLDHYHVGAKQTDSHGETREPPNVPFSRSQR
jgi:hypothetical protein